MSSIKNKYICQYSKCTNESLEYQIICEKHKCICKGCYNMRTTKSRYCSKCCCSFKSCLRKRLDYIDVCEYHMCHNCKKYKCYYNSNYCLRCNCCILGCKNHKNTNDDFRYICPLHICKSCYQNPVMYFRAPFCISCSKKNKLI